MIISKRKILETYITNSTVEFKEDIPMLNDLVVSYRDKNRDGKIQIKSRVNHTSEYGLFIVNSLFFGTELHSIANSYRVYPANTILLAKGDTLVPTTTLSDTILLVLPPKDSGDIMMELKSRINDAIKKEFNIPLVFSSFNPRTTSSIDDNCELIICIDCEDELLGEISLIDTIKHAAESYFEDYYEATGNYIRTATKFKGNLDSMIDVRLFNNKSRMTTLNIISLDTRLRKLKDSLKEKGEV